jgi:adenine deaminase
MTCVAIVDRHHASKMIGMGFVGGFRLKRGALAATTNCENQNLVIVGTNDADIAFAAKKNGKRNRRRPVRGRRW